MVAYEIKKYSLEYKDNWNEFVANSINGTFLLDRDYMDYHADRFKDHSIMIFANGKIVALLPANISENKLFSHQGLTYGGLIYRMGTKLGDLIDIIKELLDFLNKNGIQYLIFKSVPKFYWNHYTDDIDWILFKLNAKVIRKDSAFVIDNSKVKIIYQERRNRSIKKAKKLNFSIDEGHSLLKLFWQEILMPNLQEKHGVNPVHSLNEIEKLASNFPENIKQYVILLDGSIVAGCTIFETENVAHAQYISGNEIGRNSGSLDLLFDWLINERYKEKQFFDFGIANEEMGQKINKGLMDWKEGFGARAMSHDFYEINTSDIYILEDIYC
jgi:hypothetical protein